MTDVPGREQTPDLTVLIPVVERYGDLRQLYSEYAEQIRESGLNAEFVFVIDGRQREVIPTLQQVQREAAYEVVLVVMGGMFGESAALTVGLEHARGATIVTSNLDFSEWGEAFPNRLLGAATLDRLRHNAYRVVLDGDSYRAPRPLPKSAKSAVAKTRKSGNP